MPTSYVALNEDVVNPLLARNSKMYGSHYYKCTTKIFESQVSHSKKKNHFPYHKYRPKVLDPNYVGPEFSL